MNTLNAPTRGEHNVTGAGPVRVLLAVDDLLARNILREHVSALGFEVHEAVNGPDAWDKLQEGEFDVTLLLLTETASEAPEFVRKVRQENKFEALPIWVCTLLPSVKHARSTDPGATAFCNLLSTTVFSMLAQLARQVGHGASSDSELASRIPCETGARVASLLEREILSLIGLFEDLRSGDDVTRAGRCADLSKRVGSLVTCAAVAGRCRLARHAAALRTLLEEITMRPTALTAECMQTVISAAESFAAINGRFAEENDEPPTAVVLSDSVERRRTIESALSKAGFHPALFSDQVSATQHLTTSSTDLIIVHLHTPAEEVADTCKALRSLPLHAETPLIVAGLQSQIRNPEALKAAGANELLFQPSAQMEVAVAGLTLIHCRAELAAENHPAPGLTKNTSMNSTAEPPSPALDEQPAEAVPQTMEELTARCRDLGKQLDVMSRLYLEAEAKAVEQHDEKNKIQKTCAALEARLDDRGKEIQMLTQSQENATTAQPQADARNNQLAEELEFAQEEIAELTAAKTALAQQKEEADAEIARLKESTAIAPGDRAARIEAELERERGEKRRLEQRVAGLNKHLEELHARTSSYFETERVTQEKLAAIDRELHERNDDLSRAQADLQKAAADRTAALEQLRAGEALMKELREAAGVYSSAKDALQRRHEQVEARLQAVEKSAAEALSQLKNERGQRIKVEEDLTAVRQRAQENEAALAELRCELELEQAENKRLAGEAAEAKYSAIEAARATTAAVSALRDNLREPISRLLATSRQLLDTDSSPEVKKSVESLLATALSLHGRMKE